MFAIPPTYITVKAVPPGPGSRIAFDQRQGADVDGSIVCW